MRVTIIIAIIITLFGCANSAVPTYVNGQYYLVGDAKCVQVRPVSQMSLICVDKKGNNTEFRTAMTPEDIQLYQYRMVQQHMKMQELTQSLNQLGQTFQNGANQIRQQSQSWTPPQVQPLSIQQNRSTTYRRVGNFWFGSNGTNCQIIGQNIVCSDGKKCNIIGDNLICN